MGRLEYHKGYCNESGYLELPRCGWGTCCVFRLLIFGSYLALGALKSRNTEDLSKIFGIQPKLELSAKNYSRAVYECLRGTLAFTKDDGNVILIRTKHKQMQNKNGPIRISLKNTSHFAHSIGVETIA